MKQGSEPFSPLRGGGLEPLPGEQLIGKGLFRVASSFEEYPLCMVHGESGVARVVSTEAEERTLKAKGFIRPGEANPSAFLRAQDHGVEKAQPQEWPRYNAVTGKSENDPHAPIPIPPGTYPKFLNGKVIQTEDEEIALMLEADEEARIPAAVRANEKAELVKKATDRGIRVDARWGIERLRAVANGPVSTRHDAA